MGSKIMVKWILNILSCIPLILQAQEENFTDYVDPFIGSGGHGHVFIGANVPFGGVQLGPNNIYKGWDWCSGYNYADSLIIGFSHLRLSGTGIGDLGDILIMPYTGKVKLNKGKQEFPHNGYLSTFSHNKEKAEPGYYKVTMDNKVIVELTSTERVGYHKYQFPPDEQSQIIIDLTEGINDQTKEAFLERVDSHTLIGYRYSSGWAKNQKIYFAIKTSKAIESLEIYSNNNRLIESESYTATMIKGLIRFKESPLDYEMKVGISPVSTKNALYNIDKEVPDWDFDKIKKKARIKWNNELSKIEVSREDSVATKIFYTSMYHLFMHPSLFNDANGDYRGADGKVYTNKRFNNYSVFSTWDTYRAVHPLFTLLQPKRINDFIDSMLSIEIQQGYLPVWHLHGNETGTMVGISSLQIIAEAVIKGYDGFDVDKAYQAVKRTSMSDVRGMDYVKNLKPIPSDSNVKEPLAMGMELAIGDGSTALMAQYLGNKEDYEYFYKRSMNYKLYYDDDKGFFRGKLSDGSWNPHFDPFVSTGQRAEDFTEGNAWQYLWLVPQDVHGLISLLGGDLAFNERLDQFFHVESPHEEVLVDLSGAIGQYAHGNEPSHHIAYLYNYSGAQWKSAEKIRHITTSFYHALPDGIIGNEDCGQMSAWYIFSSMGFYPVFPASGKYVFGSPLFKKVNLNLPNGKSLLIETESNGLENLYIQKIFFNEKPLYNSYITHDQLLEGGKLKFVMGNQPNKQFGQNIINRP
ncbi:GH92 family glycosyl hydrolase [Galbibacter pacificus]|uniref:GH92 family glycosyl hydrolase n=1 Tax=Galbibacter pacificus TaxID=2996052 RepID=A0ABT6FN96_9FLAO|nr:GH92 family glycosyl hydrolase [Galbibacter pacificus]MDG3581066.1 GH92 family glycosyl hydrolase [Galbibacter pacificus]MDG3584544.1 GH92 family glycosyl hydrolase [Galbibacter pacificus]